MAEKNCPRAATPGQQMEIADFGEATFSDFQYSTFSGPISRFLSRGQRNAVPLRQLQAMTGLPGRMVRRIIEQERREGVPILADNQTGYFLPATEDEKMRCIRSLRHRAGEILKTAAAIERVQNEGGY